MKVLRIILLLLCMHTVYAFDHSHSAWQKVLDSSLHLNGKQSLVNYTDLKANPLELNKYLIQLTSLKQSEYDKFSKNQKLALLVNAYNAFTVKLIIDHYPVKSIKDVGSFFTGAFKKNFFSFLGHERNLDWIEHEVIRKKFKEPRVHFVLVCASISCPGLRKTALTETNIDKQLTVATSYFINNTDKNDYKDGTLYLSKIFKWYRLDFKGLHNFIIKYSKNKSIKKNTPIRWLDYNWSLNDWIPVSKK